MRGSCGVRRGWQVFAGKGISKPQPQSLAPLQRSGAGLGPGGSRFEPERACQRISISGPTLRYFPRKKKREKSPGNKPGRKGEAQNAVGEAREKKCGLSKDRPANPPIFAHCSLLT